MKYCEEYAALLDLFVDGELSLEEILRVQEHLDTCPACQSYVDDALAMRAAFPDADAEEVPEGFAAGIMTKIQAAPSVAAPKKKRKTPWMGVVASLAACCAIVIIQQNGPMAHKNASSGAYASADTAVAESAACDDAMPMEVYAEEETMVEDAVAEEADSGMTQRDSDYEYLVSDSLTDSDAQNDTAVATTPTAKEPAEEMAADGWVEGENVVFGCVVFLSADRVGNALDGYEGKPYATKEGVVGTGYAMDQAEFERILYDSFDYHHGPDLDPDRTTDLCCIVVTE